MSDARGCASHLDDNVPKWLESLSTLKERISSQIYHRSIASGKRKTDSIDSTRPADHLFARTNHSAAAIISTTTPQKDKSHSSRDTHRNRRPEGWQSSRYRSKAMVIVQYDGDVQKGFESLVREIGSARNLLRKAKLAARMDHLANNLTLSLESPLPPRRPPASKTLQPSSKAGLESLKLTRAMDAHRGITDTGSNDFFDPADKELENVQALFERSAHVHLREGNVDNELQEIVDKLHSVMQICKVELAKASDDQFDAQNEETTVPESPENPSKSLRFSMLSLEVDDEESPLSRNNHQIIASA